MYAAVRSRDGGDVFALVLLTERCDGLLYTKPVSEDMGPVEDRCTARILNRLTPPSNEHAREWRERCRARLAKPTSRPGQTVIFKERVKFTNGDEPRTLIFLGGSRRRLRKLGITVRAARSSAALELAQTLPAAILADLLGVDRSTAEDWTQLANTDWARYAAAR